MPIDKRKGVGPAGGEDLVRALMALSQQQPNTPAPEGRYIPADRSKRSGLGGFQKNLGDDLYDFGSGVSAIPRGIGRGVDYADNTLRGLIDLLSGGR